MTQLIFLLAYPYLLVQCPVPLVIPPLVIQPLCLVGFAEVKQYVMVTKKGMVNIIINNKSDLNVNVELV